MLANREEIIKFIPQRAPVVMVHTLLKADEVHAVTSLEVEDENIFTEDGRLAECGLVENMAQTAATQVGYICHQRNLPVPVGYIAMVRNLVIQRQPVVGDIIQTSIEVTNTILDVTIVEGKVTLGQDLICCGELRIFAKTGL